STASVPGTGKSRIQVGRGVSTEIARTSWRRILIASEELIRSGSGTMKTGPDVPSWCGPLRNARGASCHNYQYARPATGISEREATTASRPNLTELPFL